jgi:hypothetical protein
VNWLKLAISILKKQEFEGAPVWRQGEWKRRKPSKMEEGRGRPSTQPRFAQRVPQKTKNYPGAQDKTSYRKWFG